MNDVTMPDRTFFFSYAPLPNAELPLLKVAVPYSDKLVILDPAGASWATIGAGRHEATSRIYNKRCANLTMTS
jgi:hypothetical protein